AVHGVGAGLVRHRVATYATGAGASSVEPATIAEGLVAIDHVVADAAQAVADAGSRLGRPLGLDRATGSLGRLPIAGVGRDAVERDQELTDSARAVTQCLQTGLRVTEDPRPGDQSVVV